MPQELPQLIIEIVAIVILVLSVALIIGTAVRNAIIKKKALAEVKEVEPTEGEIASAEEPAEEPACECTECESEETACECTECESEETACECTECESEETACECTECESEEPACECTECESEETACECAECESEEPACECAECESEEPACECAECESEEPACECAECESEEPACECAECESEEPACECAECESEEPACECAECESEEPTEEPLEEEVETEPIHREYVAREDREYSKEEKVDFIDAILGTTEKLKGLYNQMKNVFMQFDGITSSITKKADIFKVNGVPIAKMTKREKLEIAFASDHPEQMAEMYGAYVSDEKLYEKTPVVFVLKSQKTALLCTDIIEGIIAPRLDLNYREHIRTNDYVARLAKKAAKEQD